MNVLLDKGHISEMKCGTNFSYNLQENSMFLPTEYKVLQSQTSSCFVRCMKMLYNGKTQLYYMVNSLKSLASMLPTLDSDSFITIVSNLLADIIDVKHNGFLSCQNIDISFEHIYIEPSTYKVQLVYLPTSIHFFSDYSSFESELRTCFVKIINGVSTLYSPKTTQLATDLSNGMLSLEDLYARTKGGKMTSRIDNDVVLNTKESVVRITVLNAPIRVELVINKNSYVIGKSAASVDGVVSFNKMISRVHCRVDKNGHKVTITDLQSANGTFVNRVRLIPNQPTLIKNGDIIRLANSDFQVSIV